MVYYKILPGEERLPKKWQQHLDSLRSSIRTLQQELEVPTEDSDTFLKSVHAYAEVADEPVGKGRRVIFVMDRERHNREVEVYLDDDGYLHVYGASSLVIELQSSNVFKVRIKD
jgi:hypothetical protein